MRWTLLQRVQRSMASTSAAAASTTPARSSPPRRRGPSPTPERRQPSSSPPRSLVAHLKPSDAYLAQSAEPFTRLDADAARKRPKLLVTDLNNCLCARTGRARLAALKATPRPYASTLFRYARKTGWDIVVFSSARSHNVEGMCQALGLVKPEAEPDEGEPVLLAMWARDRLGLSETSIKASLIWPGQGP